MMIACLATLAVACLSICFHYSRADHLPGFQIRISNKGLQFANGVAQTALINELQSLHIPNQSGRSKGLDWRISGIGNRGLALPTSRMTFDPSSNGLSWSLSGLGLDLHASYWRVKYKKGWFKLSTSGKLDLKVKRVSLKVTIRLGEAGGRPTVSMARCQASIGDVDVHFSGGTAFILNLFKGIIADKIKDILEDEMRKVARVLVERDLNAELSQLKVNIKLSDQFLLDYSLVSHPSVQSKGLDLYHKGEVLWATDTQTTSPLTPPPIDHVVDDGHMMYIWVTDYVANTAFVNAQNHGVLQYTMTERDFPADKRSILQTTCELFCIGSLIPGIGVAFPDVKVGARVASLRAPSVTITSRDLNLSGAARMEFYVSTPEQIRHPLVSFDLNVTFSLKVDVVYEKLVGEVTGFSLNVNNVQSIVDEVDPNALTLIMKAAISMGLIPALNDVMKKGLDLPVTDVISFKRTKLSLVDGSIVIATDVTTLQPRPPPTTPTTQQPQPQPQPTSPQPPNQSPQDVQKTVAKSPTEQPREKTTEQLLHQLTQLPKEQPKSNQLDTEQPTQQTEQPGNKPTQQPMEGSTGPDQFVVRGGSGLGSGSSDDAASAVNMGPTPSVASMAQNGGGGSVGGDRWDRNAYCESLINFCSSNVNYCS